MGATGRLDAGHFRRRTRGLVSGLSGLPYFSAFWTQMVGEPGSGSWKEG